MDRDKLRERYLQDEWPIQIGNLASTPSRLSSRVEDARYDRVVADLLHEGALRMEWCASTVPIVVATNIAVMPRELVLWRRMLPNDPARPLFAFRARQMADHLLEAGGATDRADGPWAGKRRPECRLVVRRLSSFVCFNPVSV
jgi:hypothetical protein